jgi:uncharacterized metal-binding protein YceD (DUF177 family)
MLVIDLTKIPADGLEVDEDLTRASAHLAADEDFTLADGGHVAAHVTAGQAGLVQVAGRVTARLGLSCGRCLEAYELEVDGPIELVYLPRDPTEGADENAVGLSDRDMVVAYYEGEQLDLGEMVREQLLLNLSMKRLCREDCRGICAQCGANRNHATCDCREAEPISPLAPLGQLVGSSGPADAEGPLSRTPVRA